MPTRQLTEDEQNAVILRIYEAAQRLVRRRSPRGTIQDRIHDLIVGCLTALRAGTFDCDLEHPEHYARTCIKRDAMDRKKLRRRVARRELEFLIEMEQAPREWMDSELALETKRVSRYIDVIRASIDPISFEAHRLVREDGLTYAQAGTRLHVSASMVHKHVSAVQQAFRRTLFAVGIASRAGSRGGRIARPTRRRRNCRRRILGGAPREIQPIPRGPRTPLTGVRELWSVGDQLARCGARRIEALSGRRNA